MFNKVKAIKEDIRIDYFFKKGDTLSYDKQVFINTRTGFSFNTTMLRNHLGWAFNLKDYFKILR